MKRLFIITLLTVSLGVNAFWGNNYNGYGYQQDNGIFGFNPYNFWDPRWYPEEMSNMFDEFDDDDWNNNNGYSYNPYNKNRYNPYNKNRYNPYNRNGYNLYNKNYRNIPWNNATNYGNNNPIISTK